jgi:superkiller protein 8
VAFSPGGKILAAAGNSGVIILYDTASGEQIANLKGDCGWIMSLAWSNTGKYLLSG